MINDSFEFSCNVSTAEMCISWTNSNALCKITADDDSDTSPHDLEMGSDVEYSNINLSLAAQLSGAAHSFTQMQVRYETEDVRNVVHIWCKNSGTQFVIAFIATVKPSSYSCNDGAQDVWMKNVLSFATYGTIFVYA